MRFVTAVFLLVAVAASGEGPGITTEITPVNVSGSALHLVRTGGYSSTSFAMPEPIPVFEPPSVYDSLGSVSCRFVVPDFVEVIGWSAFRDCTLLEEVVMTDSVREIGEDTFYKCYKLRSIKLSSQVVEIGWLAFSKCQSLERIELPQGLTKLGWSLFSDCHKLKEIIIPEGVVEIGYATFGHCYALTELILPSTLQTIGGGAFSDCSKLKSIVCLATDPPFVADLEFRGEVIVPSSSLALYQADPQWQKCSILCPIN